MQLIPMDNIKELNELIYTEAKLVQNKIRIPIKNPKRTIKPGWEMRLEKQIKKLWQQAKLHSKVKHIGTLKKEKTSKRQPKGNFDNTTERKKSQDIGKRKYQERVRQYKQNRSFQNNETFTNRLMESGQREKRNKRLKKQKNFGVKDGNRKNITEMLHG